MPGRIDRLWLKVEKFIVVAGFLLMSAVVFADVLHRVFADTAWQTPGKLVLVWGGLFLIAVGAVRTASAAVPRRKGQAAVQNAEPPVSAQEGSAAAPAAAEAVAQAEPPLAVPSISWGKALGYAAGGTALTALIAYGYVWLLPNGVIWAQKLALVLMLWVAFFGASIATRDGRHLKIDAAEKLFRGPVKKWVGLVGNLIAAAFCGALAVLAWRYCADKYALYVETDGAGGDFEGLPIPMFLAFGVLPLSLAVMSLRFIAHGVQSARGRLGGGDTLHGIALPTSDLANEGPHAGTERAP